MRRTSQFRCGRRSHRPPPARTADSAHRAQRSRHLDSAPNSHRDAESSYVVTITHGDDDKQKSALRRWQRRCRQRVETARLLAAAAGATSIPDRCRILVIGDTRGPDREQASRSSIIHLTREITYETEINGTHVDSATYLLVGDVDMGDSLRPVTDWCQVDNHAPTPAPSPRAEQSTKVYCSPDHFTC